MTWEYVFKKEHVVIEDDVHAILDLKKALWFINREVRRLQNLENNTANGQGQPSTSAPSPGSA